MPVLSLISLMKHIATINRVPQRLRTVKKAKHDQRTPFNGRRERPEKTQLFANLGAAGWLFGPEGWLSGFR
jgi:hypothetical protein